MAAGKKSGVSAEKGAAKPQKTPEELKALEEFDRITEAASALMDAGEMDIYSAVREELQRAADAFKDEDDMFADADEDDAKVCCNPVASAYGHRQIDGQTFFNWRCEILGFYCMSQKYHRVNAFLCLGFQEDVPARLVCLASPS